MEEKTNAQSYTDIWSISDEVLEKNEEVHVKTNDIPEVSLTTNNVNGFIINDIGNIVARFGFFVETEDEETLDMRVSHDGFMGAIYNRPTNIILGYGHPLHFSGLVDPKQANLLHLSPAVANGDDIIISVENDDKLKDQGIVVIMRDIDVMIEVLSEEVRDSFSQSVEDAKEPVEAMNDIENSYNAYMRHLYVILGEDLTNNTVTVETEEVYE